MASMGTTAAVYQYDFYDSFINTAVQCIVEILRYLAYYAIFTSLLDFRPSSGCVLSFVTLAMLTKMAESFSIIFYRNPVKNSTRLRRRMEAGAFAHLRNNADPESMAGYDFVVVDRFMNTPMKLGHTFITTDQIWLSCGNTADGNKLKDLCLSYALCQQLLERCHFELPCTEACLVKERDFVFRKLLPSVEDYKRAFRIIELELGFCYDFFFTKYHNTFQTTESFFPRIPCFVLPKIVLIATVVVFAIRKSLVLETSNPVIEVHSTDTDYTITVLLLIIALTVELVQTAFYLASHWAQVAVACRHVKKRCWPPNGFFEKVSAFLRRFIVPGALKNKMDQYSYIFEDKDSVEVSGAVKAAIARLLISSHGNLIQAETSLQRRNPQFDWTFSNHSQLEVMLIWHIATDYCDIAPKEGQAGNETTQEHQDHEEGRGGNETTQEHQDPEEGRGRSETTQEDQDLEEGRGGNETTQEGQEPEEGRGGNETTQENQDPQKGRGGNETTQEDQDPEEGRGGNESTLDDNRDAAINLSRYCAYLIVYVPELVPYHLVDIRELSPKVFIDLQVNLCHQPYETDDGSVIYQRMRDMEETDNPTTVFEKGVNLGKQLERLPAGDRWNVLKDFWALTIVRAATSHYTTKQHLQHLETGGEFLTHIWALLSHAGILNTSRVNPVPVMQDDNMDSSGPSRDKIE